MLSFVIIGYVLFMYITFRVALCPLYSVYGSSPSLRKGFAFCNSSLGSVFKLYFYSLVPDIIFFIINYFSLVELTTITCFLLKASHDFNDNLAVLCTMH